MSVIGGALLLFIVTLTDLNSCARPNVEAEVNGTELTYEDLEVRVKHEETITKIVTGKLNDDAKDQIREGVWQQFVQENIINKQAGKLGLVASKADVQNALAAVSPQQLEQVAQALQYGQTNVQAIPYAQKIMMMMARIGAQPTAAGYKQFLKEIDKSIAQIQKQNPEQAQQLLDIKEACLYCESRIPAEVITQKYLAMVSLGQVANPVGAKMDFDEAATNCNLELAFVPTSSVEDKEISFTDDDLKAKYESVKDIFFQNMPSRDIKYINVKVTASTQDIDDIKKQVESVEDTLRKVTDAKAVERIMRSAKTDVPFANVYLKKDAFTETNINVVASHLDSMHIGQVTPTELTTYGEKNASYFATIKLIDAQTTPDSMQVCQFAIDDKAKADAIIKAVKAGSTLSAEAAKHQDMVKKYGLKGDTIWQNTAYYLAPETTDSAASDEYKDVCQMSKGTTGFVKVTNPQDGKPVFVITTVLDTKALTKKYNVAAVLTPVKFTTATYNDKRKQLNAFLAKNKTIEDIEKNAAKAGFTINQRPGFTTSDAMTLRMNIGGEGAKQAMMWAFEEAEVGEVSKLYECGKENDQLLVVALTAVNKGDYRAWDNPTVKQQLTEMVKAEKKAEKIMAMAKNVKDFKGASALKNVQTDSQPEISLGQLSMYVPALAGAVERTAAGKFTGAVKTATTIYFAQVNGKSAANGATYNETAALAQSNQRILSRIFGQQGGLYDAFIREAKIKDNRFKF
ncbi:MAG: SurA N-terminal domain-containing protein [Alloprevotella sp.]